MGDVKEIIKALDDNFIVKHNVLYDRNQFYSAAQQQHETIKQFLDRLRHLALTCKFAQEENMIRDFLVLRCRDSAATTRLFRKQEEPTLKVAIDELKVSESTKKQMKSMASGSEQQLHHMKNKRTSPKKDTKQQYRKPKQQATQRNNNDCIFCGKVHKPGKTACPAYGKTCSKCKRQHHFASVCFRQRVVKKVDQENASAELIPWIWRSQESNSWSQQAAKEH